MNKNVTKNLIYCFIIFLAVISCEKDKCSSDESFMTFNANGTDYDLNYLTCQYYPSSILESLDKMTHIRGVQNIKNINENDSIIVQLELPEINIFIPGQKEGIWTDTDSISFIIGIEENTTFIKEKKLSTDSEFLIEIEEYDGIYCIGNFSGDLINESNKNLIVKNGIFKIKIE
ncbi:MAG: hypothetical protein ACOCWW_03300 [Bacteroidota bacterium]